MSFHTHKSQSLLGALLLILLPALSLAQDGRALVERMMEAVGGRENFYAQGDVEYRYTYEDLASGKKDVSLERYLFDGERSWGKYLTRQNSVFPDMPGEIIQGFDGETTWMTRDGKLIEDPQMLRLADFLRKTNYYWFTMMFKLLDPGVNYQHQGEQEIDGAVYDLVKITFGGGVGDVQDTYVLYLNRDTHLVDRFLFTVMDFGMSDPHLMLVEYETVNGLKLPAHRKYAPADWEGNITEEKWAAEISENIRFGQGFSPRLFEKPE